MPYLMIGVMGPGETASDHTIQQAYQLGRLIAQQGWVLLSGGRNTGIMEAVSRGAKAADGLVVGILPHSDRSRMSAAVDIAIVTDLGNARNNINVLSSDVVIAFEGSMGTLSEVALALKAEKPVILLDWSEQGRSYLRAIAPHLSIAADPDEAIAIAAHLLKSESQTS
ncbi:MAG: TIGR00725 family protein [Synechococcales cyanobacterium T60_A2020_003]|nr:TIGR00725 family protein [Synechococcales cyanobacterium T60_A2020_003]